MDKAQLGLKLFLKKMDIEPSIQNYDDILKAAYLALQRGIPSTDRSLHYDPEKGVYCHPTRDHYMDFGCGLLDHILEVIDSVKRGENEKAIYSERVEARVKKLKKDIKEHGLDELVKREAVAS